jgi:hypothetical protein
VALSEAASARALRADPKVSLDDIVRLQRAAVAAMRRLHLDRHKPQASGERTLGDLLRDDLERERQELVREQARG